MKTEVLIFGFIAIIVIGAFSFVSCSDNCDKIEKEWSEAYAKEKGLKADDFDMNVYIENSGSIDGYVSGMNLFKTDTYALISNEAVDDVKLYYINSKPLPQTTDARDFILNLTPSSFKIHGGDRTTSDISAIIGKATKDASKTPTLLVSDFIVSPSAQYRQKVLDFFNLQKNDIKNTIAKLLKNNSNLAVVVLQGVSDFNGYYYDKNDTPSKYTGKRPYYTMLVGSKQQLALLMNKTKETTHFNHGYSEFAPSVVNYEILTGKDYKVGNFRPCKKSKHHIEKVQTERRGDGFEFNVAVDFSNIPLNELYLCDKNNYKINDGCYTVKDVKPCRNIDGGFTHIITIASTGGKPRSSDNMEMTLLKKFPEWIKNSMDNEGLRPVAGKTFGIQPLLEGVQLAYSDKFSDNYYVRMKFILEN